jgi:glycosyltransferase involved in cell wall biosynthesis
MRVLVLTQYYWPETFRITEVVESLQRVGCHITVLTGQPNYPQGKVFAGYRAAGFRVQQHELGYSIYRVPIVPRGRGGARGLVVNYLSFVFSASVLGPWMLRKQRFDVIFVFGVSPILQTIPAVVLKWFKHAKLVTWVQDLWPQSLEATGFARNRRVLDMVAVLVRWIYRRCDLLLVQSQAFIPIVQAMASKTPVQYHPYPGELAFSQARPLCVPALLLEPGFNVVFAGNLGTVQALGTLLDAAELLRPHADVRIVLVGSGSRSEWLEQEVLRRQSYNVQLAGRFAPAAMPGILTQASALLVSLVRNPIMSQTVPSKVQAYLAAGKPIIASLDGEGARVVEESGAGVSCPAEDAAALAEAVLRLRAMPFNELQRMGEAGLIYYKQHFAPAALAAKLLEHFSQVLGGRKQ